MTRNIQTNSEERILKAAEELFLAKGYASTKTTQIAEKAGVTHAMLHYYFRTKEHLFDHIVNKKMQFIFNSISQPLSNNECSFSERIKNIIEAHFDFLTENPNLPRFIINEVLTNKEHCNSMLEKITPMINLMASSLQNEANRATEKGEIESINVKMLMLDIISLNVMTFITFPFFDSVFPSSEEQKNIFLAARKTENITLILKRIQKI